MVDIATIIPQISQKTIEQLKAYEALLLKWNQKINLISRHTEQEIWQRHIIDSAQIYPYLEQKDGLVVDLGSGAGFPGVVLAILGMKQVVLVESDLKKCTFLQQVKRELGLNLLIEAKRIEQVEPYEARYITARALASVNDLLPLMIRFCIKETDAFLLKGERVDEELQAVDSTHWTFQEQRHNSLVHPTGCLLHLSQLSRND